MTESGQRAASGYTLVLPPGWARIPLRGGTNAAIRELLNAKFKHLPRDTVAPYRAEIEKRLKQQITEARNAGGVDMYFPVEISEIGPLPASFVVSDIRLDQPEHAGGGDQAMVVASLAADAADEPGTRVVEIDGAAGLRTEELVAAKPDAEFGYESRGVKYTLPMPGTPGRWLLVMFATPGAADPTGRLADVLVQLFDAIMGTFRWTHGPPDTGRPD